MPDDSPESGIRKIALIRPSALGDVCRTVPVLVSLKRAYPQAEIDWIVQDSFIDAVRAHPDLSGPIPFARKRFSRAGRNLAVTGEMIDWIRRLRERKYDVVYDLQGLARSALIARSIGAPKRVGFADAREGAFLAYTHPIRVGPNVTHTVDRMLGLVAGDGVPPVADMRLYAPDEDKAWWARKSEFMKGPYAVLAPTSRWEAKRWPAERFAEIIDSLHERGFAHVVVVGSQTERDQCDAVIARADGKRIVDLVGGTTIGQLMAVIQNCGLIIANDSAALHMAVGFDCPFVALFGPTDISRVGPYHGDEWVLQEVGPDEKLHHKDARLGTSIMERISVSAVREMVDRCLGASRGAPENAVSTDRTPSR